jgi:hypothetical protein
LQNLGQSIGGAIQNYGEAKKEQRKVDAYNKASAKSIEAAITLGDSYGIKGARETLSPFLSAANDPNLSPIEKAALLDEAKAMIPNVFGRFDKSEAVRIEQAAMNARNATPVAPLTFTPTLLKTGGGDIAVKIGSDGNYYDESGQFPITDLQAYAEGQPPEVYSSGARQSAANAIDAGLTLPAYGGANESPPVVYGADGAPMLLPPPVGTFDTPNPLIPIDPSVIDAGIALNAGQAAPVVGEPPASIARRPELKSRIIQSGEDKQVETFRPATAEESAPFGGVPGQVSVLTKKFYPVTASSPELKERYMLNAAKAYAAGDMQQSLIFATAAGIGGLFGNLRISDLPDYFGAPPEQPSAVAPTTPAQGGRKPLVPIDPSPQK